MYDKIMSEVGAAAEQSIPQNETDYRDADGILICGNCSTPKEVRVEFLGVEKVVRCLCRCAKEEYDRETAEFKARQDAIEINRLRSVGIQDQKILSYTFANDDGRNPKVADLARRYVDKFAEMRENNCGLLFYGDTGTGKSYFAGCIGNALIDRGVSVLATSITEMISELFSTENKNALLRDICRYDLLVIDDIGAERGTEYALEQVYTVIDKRYKSDKPVIITTNKTPQQLAAAQDINLQRIYDRIFEMCTPIKVEGKRRKEAGQAKARKLNEILYGG